MKYYIYTNKFSTLHTDTLKFYKKKKKKRSEKRYKI